MINKNDGGPAFPLQYDPYVDHPSHGRVHRSAVGEDVQTGMSLRDYFAGQALAGLSSNQNIMLCAEKLEGTATLAGCAYEYADAMIAERDKEEL